MTEGVNITNVRYENIWFNNFLKILAYKFLFTYTDMLLWTRMQCHGMEWDQFKRKLASKRKDFCYNMFSLYLEHY